ncbi:MAG: DUF736 family protein [Magnetospiraceae bacterium]
MSIECGYCIRQEVPGKPTVFHGELENIPNIGGEFYLIPHPTKRGENSPDYAFKIRAQDGNFVHFGNAWIKNFKDGGGSFFSITIDGPGMGAPVYVSAFPDDEQPKETPKDKPSNFTIRWGRPRGGMSMAANQAPVNDAIPY